MVNKYYDRDEIPGDAWRPWRLPEIGDPEIPGLLKIYEFRTIRGLCPDDTVTGA